MSLGIFFESLIWVLRKKKKRKKEEEQELSFVGTRT